MTIAYKLTLKHTGVFWTIHSHSRQFRGLTYTLYMSFIDFFLQQDVVFSKAFDLHSGAVEETGPK